MPNHSHQKTNPLQPMIYQIRIEGHLGQQWKDWFEDMAVSPQEDGATLLTGLVIDQAALYGLLKKVRDLGMPLLSVNRLEPSQAPAPDVYETHKNRSKKE